MICMFVFHHILIYLFEGSYAIKNIFYLFFKSNYLETIKYNQLRKD